MIRERRGGVKILPSIVVLPSSDLETCAAANASLLKGECIAWVVAVARLHANAPARGCCLGFDVLLYICLLCGRDDVVLSCCVVGVGV